MKAFRDIRVMPVVVVAIFGFAVLKIAGLVIDGGYVFDYDPQPTQKSWAQDSFNFPTGRTVPGGRVDPGGGDITGSVDEKKDEKKEEPPKPEPPAVEPSKPEGSVTLPAEGQAPVSASERAILERLQSRRQELEARAREIDIRESLLKAAEKKVESRVEELKGVEFQDFHRDRPEERGRCRALQGHHHDV